MPTNIEIKARLHDVPAQRGVAERISDTPCELIEQVDTFFNVRDGRLKLREFDERRGELIGYQRDDQAGPKSSQYSITRTDQPRALCAQLAAALGVLGVVKKSRYLYLVGQTRIHFDEVEGLGWYLELEVVLRPGQSSEEGQRIAEDLMRELDVRDEDLVECAYVDLLLKG